jgi:hypothetical protein
MKIYNYLTATPDALIASMPPPEKFGSYLLTGTKEETGIRGDSLSLMPVSMKMLFMSTVISAIVYLSPMENQRTRIIFQLTYTQTN